MTKFQFQMIEKYMCHCMNDSAHDKEHIYRVLYVALEIAMYEDDVDYDKLICACLLHDIGRREQYENPDLCHADVGSEKAKKFLLENKFSRKFAEDVAACIKSHRFRTNILPQSIEAKILFDADKLDATGTFGIARTLFYISLTSEPLYTLLPDGNVSDGNNDKEHSFFKEYKHKLEGLYENFFTQHGRDLAKERQKSAVSFYNSMFYEAQSSYKTGLTILGEYINDDRKVIDEQ